MGLPELGRVADRFCYAQGLPEGFLCFVPLPVGKGDLPPEPPPLNQILPRIGARRKLQTLVGELVRSGCVSARQPELSQAREEVR
jgi:hypothetical protein